MLEILRLTTQSISNPFLSVELAQILPSQANNAENISFHESFLIHSFIPKAQRLYV